MFKQKNESNVRSNVLKVIKSNHIVGHVLSFFLFIRTSLPLVLFPLPPRELFFQRSFCLLLCFVVAIHQSLNSQQSCHELSLQS